MSCQEQSDAMLWEYLDDELPVAVRQRVAEHVARCDICQERLRQLNQRPLALGQMRFAAPPPDLHRRVMARVRMEARFGHHVAESGWLALVLGAWQLAAASAAALILALVGVAVVAAVLAVPAVEAATPTVGTPLANSMLIAMRQALLPVRPFFATWGWFILGAGMLAAVMAPGVRALAVRYSRHS